MQTYLQGIANTKQKKSDYICLGIFIEVLYLI